MNKKTEEALTMDSGAPKPEAQPETKSEAEPETNAQAKPETTPASAPVAKLETVSGAVNVAPTAH